MIIKIGDKIYDGNDELIMAKLSVNEKRLISDMAIEAEIFCVYPQGDYKVETVEKLATEFKASLNKGRRVTDKYPKISRMINLGRNTIDLKDVSHISAFIPSERKYYIYLDDVLNSRLTVFNEYDSVGDYNFLQYYKAVEMLEEYRRETNEN